MAEIAAMNNAATNLAQQPRAMQCPNQQLPVTTVTEGGVTALPEPLAPVYSA